MSLLNSVQTGKSELQAALASAFSQFRYTSVIQIAATVEYDLSDALCNCFFGNHLANFSCCCLVATVSGKALTESGSAYQGYALHIIDDLCANVRVGTIYGQTRTLGSTRNLCSDSLMSLKTSLVCIFS